MNDWIKVLDVRIQRKSPSLASLGFGGNLSHCSLSIFPPSYLDQTNTIIMVSQLRCTVTGPEFFYPDLSEIYLVLQLVNTEARCIMVNG